ncbi:MAG: uracil-DNA glycosylase [Candidatus Nanoarchaeia archaeon]
MVDEIEQQMNNLRLRAVSEIDDELSQGATQIVFGKGTVSADIFFIGEAPGAKEDEQGVPFIGRAGQELDKMLHIIGLTLDDCYIANVLKFRPPKNRDPKREEIEYHLPYLLEQIQIIKPKILVPLGNYATKLVLSNFDPHNMKSIEGMAKMHGRLFSTEFLEMKFQVFPIYHPSAMMYNGSLRQVFEEDFKKLGKFLGKQIIDTESNKEGVKKEGEVQKTLF